MTDGTPRRSHDSSRQKLLPEQNDAFSSSDMRAASACAWRFFDFNPGNRPMLSVLPVDAGEGDSRMRPANHWALQASLDRGLFVSGNPGADFKTLCA